jgi:hypothetical protein
MVDPRFQKLKELLPTNVGQCHTLTIDLHSSHSLESSIERGLSYLEIMAIVLIVIGSILLVIGFLGCCGAMKQVKLFLTCYAIIVMIILLVQVAFAIYFVVFQSRFKDQFVPKLRTSLQNTYEGPLGLMENGSSKPSVVSLAWDFIMYNVRHLLTRRIDGDDGLSLSL